jgi:hypothetical protein
MTEQRTAESERVVTRVAREVEHDVQRVVETQERVVRVPQVERVETLRHRYETQPPEVIREPGVDTHTQRHTRTREERAPRVIDRAQPQAASTPEPTIHVSIGRIEVRAVPQQQQPQRDHARGNRMTIDDYVARRKAKERR